MKNKKKSFVSLFELFLILIGISLFSSSLYIYTTDYPLRDYLFGVISRTEVNPIGVLIKKTGSIRKKSSGDAEFKEVQIQEKILAKQFRDITKSIVYGQIIIGILQGVLAGIGFLIFGIPNSFKK